MASKQLNAVITIGGTVTGSLKAALGTTRTKLREIGSTIRDLERDQKKLGASMRDGLQNGRPIGEVHRKYAALTELIRKARNEQERMNREVRRMDDGKVKIGSALQGLATVGAVAATAGAPIVMAASFEKAMLGVAKQVDGARDKGGQLTQVYRDVAREIQMLGREIPVATNELALMAASGARMGVAKKDLIGFTRETAKMATALDLPREQLADDMGKIATLYKIPIPAIKQLGDAVNYLDDNAISKGGDIIDFLRRTGGVAGAVRITGKEMAALGSTLLSLGEPAETASTATNAFFQKLAAADKGTKKFRRAMDDIGMSTAEVQKGMQVDAEATVQKVLDAVAKLPAEKRLGVLVDMVGLEHSDTIAKLAGNMGEWRKQIALVNSEKAKGSMDREFAAQLATTNAQWEITKNRAYEAGVNIGAVFLPAVNRVMGVIGGATSAVADFAREHPVLAKNIGLVIGSTLAGAAAFNVAKLAMGGLGTAVGLVGKLMATNPIGLAALAIGTAAVVIYENWEPIKGFFANLWGGIKSGAETAWSWMKAGVKYTPIGAVIAGWGPLKSFFGGLWGGIKDVTGTAMDWIKAVMAWSPTAAITGAWGGVSGYFAGLWGDVKTRAGGAWEGVKAVFLNATPLGLVVKNWGPLKTYFGGLFDGIRSTIGSAIDWALQKIGAVSTLWHGAKKLFNAGETVGRAIVGKPPKLDGKREHGGPVLPGRTYLVGEAGPEIVTFGDRGNVMPAGETRRMLDPKRPFNRPAFSPGETRRIAEPRRSTLAPAATPSRHAPPSFRQAPPPPPIAAPRGSSAPAPAPVQVREGDTHFHITQLPGEDADALADKIERRIEAKRKARRGASLYDQPRGY